MDLLIATTNPGKLREIRAILEGTSIELKTLADFPSIEEPEETGATFEENARLKALYYADATGMLTAADDSGLVIDALDGAPGVHSARWHGTDYGVKFAKIRELLAARGLMTSPARFVCAVALARDGRVIHETRGTVEGRIAETAAGDKGFGYDPIFFYPPLGLTLAQLERDQKSDVSHRGKAFSALREYLISDSHLSRFHRRIGG
jgi:XTP/dITP diphosphohydrolase